MSIRKVKMATAMLILFNRSKRGISIGVFKTPQFLHSQKLCTCLGQKYHLEWYFLMRPAQTLAKTSKSEKIGLPPFPGYVGTCTIMYEKILATIRKSGLYGLTPMAYSTPKKSSHHPKKWNTVEDGA